MSGTTAHALAFARHGYGVVPLHWPIARNGRLACSCGKSECPAPAKHPFGKLAPNGLLSATTDPGIIKHWFGIAASAANLGVRTDELVVLDADPRHGGDEALAALEREHPFPPTWRVLTGGGGEHVYFRCPENVAVPSSQAQTNPLLGPGLDVRARGGYVCAPPSRHMSGRAYAWSVDHHPRDVPLADAPPWLIERLAARAGGAAPKLVPPGIWRGLVDEVTEYTDAAAAKVAGHLLRRGVDAALASGLLHAWNRACCKPPLPADQLDRVFDRVAHLEAARIERELL